MVLSKNRLLFWLLTILAIGLATGYLFSSKFCSMSIGSRVEKISTLNQTLRKLFYHNAIWTHEYLKSTIFNISDKNLMEQQLIANNQKISSIFNHYYDAAAGQKISAILDQQKNILDKAFDAVKFHDDAINDYNALAKSTALYLNELNPSWTLADAQSFANIFISKSGKVLVQTIKALHNKDWQQSVELFKNNLDLSLQSADELDRAITAQFPHKF